MHATCKLLIQQKIKKGSDDEYLMTTRPTKRPLGDKTLGLITAVLEPHSPRSNTFRISLWILSLPSHGIDVRLPAQILKG